MLLRCGAADVARPPARSVRLIGVRAYADSVVDMPVNIVEYDPGWQQGFAEQRDRLAGILWCWLAESVEHVGSTAVPGLASKPVVDILAPVASLVEARKAVPIIEEDGWLYWPTDPNRSWRLWFLRPKPDARTHHLYLIQHDDPHAVELRTFRDVLRANDDLRDQYQALKRNLANVFRDDRQAYTEAKAHFIESTLRESGIEGRRRPRSE
jgi:GrpB-like predicted nucleotidyltransferase (UPF0157 family)